MATAETKLGRYLHHDEMEALQRRWTPRQDGDREDIVHEGRVLLAKGRPQIADDVVVRLLDSNIAVIFSTGQTEDYRYTVLPQRNRLIAKLSNIGLLFQMLLDPRRDPTLSDDWKERING